MQTIYNNNKYIISTIKNSVYAFRGQNFDVGLRQFTNIINVLSQNMVEVMKHKSYFNDSVITVEDEVIMGILENITNAQKNREYILLADLLELQLMSLIISWQEVIQSKEDIFSFDEQFERNIEYLREYDNALAKMVLEQQDVETGYAVEPTTSGSVTIKVRWDNQEFYLLSNNDPQNAAEIFADTYYSPRASRYLLFGMELLNNANALLGYKDAECVDVYESDLNIIKLACRYGSLYYLSIGRLNIYYDPDYTKFAKASQKCSENQVITMHQPSIRNIRDDKIRERFEHLFMVDSSIRNQGAMMLSNFISNVKHCGHYVDELAPEFEGKDVYIIAAGPSLDKNIDQLKVKPRNSIILAVGTVYKKLENMGINVDYVIVSDPHKRVIGQMVGVKNNIIPMLVLSTAYREFAIRNEGEQYLICQQDFKEAEEFVKNNNCNLYKTGGSVTTTALDVSIRLGARRIILLGVDLAYTDNLAHATGTSRREHTGTDGLIPVKAMNGNTVYASKLFVMYREWIENRIQDEKDVEVIDATEGGALIKGTTICALSEIIQ